MGADIPALHHPFWKGGLWDAHSRLVAHRRTLLWAVDVLLVFIYHGVNRHSVHKRSFWFDPICLLPAPETGAKPQQSQDPVATSIPQNWGSFQGYRTTLCNFTLWALFLLWIMVYSQITRHLSPGLVLLKSLLSQSILSSCDDSPIFVPAWKGLTLQNPTCPLTHWRKVTLTWDVANPFFGASRISSGVNSLSNNSTQN